MSSSPLDLTARAVFAGYPALQGGRLLPLGNHGGFSGARLWQVETASARFCLRAWPANGPSPEKLRRIHGLMIAARKTGLRLVPEVLRSQGGDTFVASAGRWWDVTSWLPGRADFQERPSSARVAAACTALARVHEAWVGLAPSLGVCPAVARRLRALEEWQRMLRSDWKPPFGANIDPAEPWAERAWYALGPRLPRISQLLTSWLNRPLPLQPCLCDIWHEHVLFEGETVTGLVDYGSCKVDHVAVDLARLLGSMAGDDAAFRTAGLNAYRSVRPLTVYEEALVSVLDETGTMLGAANWLKWLYHDGRRFEDRTAVTRRLTALVERMERWP